MFDRPVKKGIEIARSRFGEERFFDRQMIWQIFGDSNEPHSRRSASARFSIPFFTDDRTSIG